MSELRKCPFCGGEAKICGYYFIQCVKCGSSTLTHTNRESAIKTWNTRKPVGNILERLKEEFELAEKDMGECTFKGMSFHDTAKGYATAMYNAIKIIKEELMK